MATSFAAVIFRPEQLSEQALSHGFGVALAGYDLKKPNLLCAEIPGHPEWKAAFYRSGHATKDPGASYEEFDHICELFEDELPPGRCVCDAAEHSEAIVYALVYSDEMLHDDGFRFDKSGFERAYVHEVEGGVELGRQNLENCDVQTLSLDEEDPKFEAQIKPARGSAFLAEALGFPVLSSLVQAFFMADQKLGIRILEATPETIAKEVERLNAVLRRSRGRGAFVLPDTLWGVRPPASLQAFVQTYDWADPQDPSDLYRELAIGGIEGTFRFMRPADFEAKERDGNWQKSAKQGLFPLGLLKAGGLSGGRKGDQTLALLADGEYLVLVDSAGKTAPAGPTFAEFLRYLALGWKKRDEVEEDLIEALMLKAKVRQMA